MKINNPTLDPPTWSLNQRRMFEALVSDYALYCYHDKSMQAEIRERIKSKYDVTSTYELTTNEVQDVITKLVDTIQRFNPNYNTN